MGGRANQVGSLSLVQLEREWHRWATSAHRGQGVASWGCSQALCYVDGQQVKGEIFGFGLMHYKNVDLVLGFVQAEKGFELGSTH